MSFSKLQFTDNVNDQVWESQKATENEVKLFVIKKTTLNVMFNGNQSVNKKEAKKI